MGTIQVAITDAPYANVLRELLIRNGIRNVQCVDDPDPARDGVIVVDVPHFERLPAPIRKPERIVLIAHNEPQQLSQAWEAGVTSVIYQDDPLNTAVLAILATRLRSDNKGRVNQT